MYNYYVEKKLIILILLFISKNIINSCFQILNCQEFICMNGCMHDATACIDIE